ncbi:MAG: acyltransferase domain-containing protein [Alphaproteobacteria bacterium]|nr:acyltransferase domain-containing protein [Alphaproteobacteria bacterium]
MTADIRTGGREPVAIVATGAIFPGRGTTDGFWRDIFEGVDTLSQVPETHWLSEDFYDPDPASPDKTYSRRGGFLSPQAFDPVAFGIPPQALETTDTSQLLALLAAKRLLATAERESGGRLDKARTSVVLGVASATELIGQMSGRLSRPAWIRGLREAGLAEDEVQDIASKIEANFPEWQESTFPGLLGNVVAGRIANRLDLGGSNYVTDAACASSLSALQLALHELRAGDSDTVITGGVDTLNDILMFMCFSKTPAFSPSGDVRPYSAQADGTLIGEGIGLLALRRLSDAERDGNRIHALIRGLGGASDGKGTAIYAPLAGGQAKALRRAYEQAGYGPDTVTLVEGHGTGTLAGDRTELRGLHDVFAPQGAVSQPWCAIGSVKSQIGHTKAAAGSASLLKVAGALSRRTLPASIKVDRPNDVLCDGSPFYINTSARPWVHRPDAPRRASVSSFGFGGSNFHVTLEEYRGPNAARPSRVASHELVIFSAESEAGLAEQLRDAMRQATSEDDLVRLASASHERADPKAPARAAITAANPQEFQTRAEKLAAHLQASSDRRGPLGAGIAWSSAPPAAGKLAFLFSGQASQYVGMGAGLAMAFPDALRVWDEALLNPGLDGLDLHNLAFPPTPFSEEEALAQAHRLSQVRHAQPAIAAVTLAQLAVLERLGLQADMCAGHSFGEIMALHHAGAFDASSALSMAAVRARVMADAAEGTQGAMMAVQTGAEHARSLLPEDCGVVVANDNAPGQSVLSGPCEAIDAVGPLFEAKDVKARKLDVGTGFHSELVADACAPFADALAEYEISAPRRPVIANGTASAYGDDPGQIRDRLARQIAKPVRFRECVEALYDRGARIFVEVGPGNVISGLARNTLADRDVQIVALDTKRGDGIADFLSGLGQLFSLGRALDFAALFDDLPPPPEPEPPGKFTVMLSGANYNKPYPPEGGSAALPPPNTTAARTPEMTEAKTTHGHAAPSPVAATPAPAPASEAERVYHDLAARHADFLQAMTSAHTAFMNAASGLLGAAPTSAPAAHPRLQPQAAPAPTPAPTPAPAPGPVPASPAPMPAPMASETPSNGPATNGAAGHAIPSPPAAPPAASTASMPSPSASDPVALVTKLVAEKTGYPDEMLDADMDLEGELGIDSIKQVEILSALREARPDLPEVAPERLAELRTIRLVADFIAGAPPAPHDAPDPAQMAPAAQPAAPAPPPAQPALAEADGGAITTDTVRALIAEKTGYPPEMLEEDMDLEGELGIDSIKQVEILSALRESYPDLPEIEPERLAELRTIGQIAGFFH